MVNPFFVAGSLPGSGPIRSGTSIKLVPC